LDSNRSAKPTGRSEMGAGQSVAVDGSQAPPRSDITLAEVAQHSTPEDGWAVLRGKVFNLTPFMKLHPGGEKVLKLALGKDCTALFNKHHGWVNADALLAKCLVGKLAPSA
jgi:cytochrome-b5 reductase